MTLNRMSELTNHEAAQQIECLIIDNEDDGGVYLGQLDIKALRMAIAALTYASSAEPESNCKEQIRVGDEVQHNSSEEIAIAIRALPTCVYGIVTSKDELELAQWNIYNLTKTGRSFPEVAELLEKMKEES